jgi:hypothetical protein
LDHVVGDVGVFMLVHLGVVAVLLRCHCLLLSWRLAWGWTVAHRAVLLKRTKVAGYSNRA